MKCKVVSSSNEKLNNYIERFGQQDGLRMFLEGDRLITNGEAFTDMFGKSSVTSHEALRRIADSKNALSVLAKWMLSKQLPSIPITVITEEEALPDHRKANAYYDPFATKISIIDSATKQRSTESLVLHEILHYYTSEYLRLGGGFTSELVKVFEHAKATTSNPELYGYKDIYEFISELFVNPDFAKDLAKLQPTKLHREYKNLFEEIWDDILKLLGINKSDKSLYQQAFSLGTQILEDSYLFETADLVDNEIPQNILELIEDEDTLKSRLLKFLDKLNVSVEFKDDLKEFGLSGLTDLLYKTIQVTNDKSLYKETAYVAYSFLGKKNKIRTDLIHSIDQLSNYQEIFNKYKKRNPNLYDAKIKELIVVDFLADAIENNWNNPKDSYINREASYWELTGTPLQKRIKYQLLQIKMFFSKLIGSKLSTKEVNNLLDDIAHSIISQNMSKFNTNLHPSQQKVNYEKTIESDPNAAKIIKDFQDLGLLLTGSLSLRKQGTVYRGSKETIHDLDFSLERGLFNDYLKEVVNRIYRRGINISNAEIKGAAMSELRNAPIINKIKELYPTFKITKIFGGSENNLGTISGQIIVENKKYAIDLFFRMEEDIESSDRGLQHWVSIFKAKLFMGRSKDIRDFANYVPYDIKPNKLAQEKGFRHFNYEMYQGIKVLSSKIYKNIYERFGLLNKDGIPKIVDPKSADTKRWLDSLNRSSNYKFVAKLASDGKYHMFVVDDGFNQATTQNGNTIQELDSAVTKFLNTIGVTINTLEEVKALDANGNEISIVAKADLLKGIIDISKGLRGIDTLTEEAAHFLVELLGDTHPLVKQMLNDIEKFDEYQQVVNEYGNLEAYKDNELKLRKEAVGKLIARLVVEDHLEGDRALQSRFKRLIDLLFGWLKSKSKYSQEMLNSLANYKKAASMILNNDASELMTLSEYKNGTDLTQAEFYQKVLDSDQQRKDVIDKLKDEKAILNSKTNKYNIIATGQEILHRSTDFVKRLNYEIFRRYDRQDKNSLVYAENGVYLHAVLAKIVDVKSRGETPSIKEIKKIVIDELKQDERLKDKPDAFFDSLTTKVFGQLVKAADGVFETIDDIEKRIREQTGMTDDEWEERKPVLFTEKVLFDERNDIAGTADLIVVHSNGAISIFDWKTMKFFIKDGKIQSIVEQSKLKAWDVQLSLYQMMITNSTGHDNFGVLRIVPISAEINKIGHIKNVTVQDSKNPIPQLNQVPTTTERTEDEQLNKNLDRWVKERDNLRDIYLRNKGRYDLLPKIEKLDEMINDILRHRKFDAVAKAIENLYNNFREGEHWKDVFTFEELNNAIEAVESYESFATGSIEYLEERIRSRAEKAKTDASLAVANKQDKESVINLRAQRDHLADLKRMINNKKAQGFSEAINDAGTKKGWLARWFNRLSQYDRGVFKELNKLVKDNHEYVRSKVNEAAEKIGKAKDALEKWAESNGKSLIDAYHMIYNHKSGKLYTRTSSKFYEDRDKAIALGAAGYKWFLDNTEIAADVVENEVDGDVKVTYRYTGKAKSRYEAAYKRTEEQVRTKYKGVLSKAELEERVKTALAEFEKKNDVKHNFAGIVANGGKYLVYNNNGKYDSEEWKTIQNTPELKEFYDMFVGSIQELADLEGIDVDIKEGFVPNVHRSLLENMRFGGAFGLTAVKDSLIHLIATQENDQYKGYLSADTDVNGNPINHIPLLFFSKLQTGLSTKEKSEIESELREVYKERNESTNGINFQQELDNKIKYAERKKGLEEKSADLSRSLLLFVEAAHMHSALKQTEDAVIMLKHIIRSEDQRTILRDRWGRKKIDKLTGTLAYQKGVPQEEIDALDKFIDIYWYGRRGQESDFTFNAFGREISSTKMANLFFKTFSAQAMALKPLLAFGNLMGAKFNSWMLATEGIYFNQKQLAKAQSLLSSRDSKYAALIKFFEPHAHDMTLEKANKLSATKLTEWLTFSNLFILHRKGDEIIDNNILAAMLMNYGIDDNGKVQRLAKLKDGAKSLYDMAELTDSGLKIAGLTSEEFTRFRALVKDRANAIKGSIPQDDVNLVNTALWMQAIMQFRNWMPGLIGTRFKQFGKNVNDEEYDVGRFRVMFSEIFNKGFVPTLKNLGMLVAEITMIKKVGADSEVAKKLYDAYVKSKQIDPKDFTIEDFIALRTAKMQGMVRELQLYLALFFLVFATKAMIPDDKDDPMYKTSVIISRAALRSYLEVSFFLNPNSTVSVLKGMVPQLSFVNNLTNLISHTFVEGYYTVAPDNRTKVEKGKPLLYYYSKNIPAVSGITDFFDIFDSYTPKSNWKN